MFSRMGSWLAGLLQRNRWERDMEDELAFHLAQRTDHYVKRGLSAEDARRRARLEFGAGECYKEECRESRGLRLADEIRADLLYALRGMRRSPGFSAVVIVSLALGIGANTAMFSVVNGVLLRPLPYRDQDRLVSLEESMSETQFALENFRPMYVNFLLHRDELGSFEDMIAMGYARYRLVDIQQPEELQAAWVTANFCAFLGVQPVLGRCFTADEEAGRARVALLSYELWHRQFGADPLVLGRSVALKDYSGDIGITVIGVLPRGFHLGWDSDLWLPLSESPNYRTRDELLTVQRRMFPQRYEGAGGLEIHVALLAGWMTQTVKPALTVLMGVVGLVLAIACSNAANLMLSRGAERVREVAVRASLGAGRWRICRQMLTETGLLATIGGGFGLLVAHWIVKGVKALAMTRLPRAGDIHMDWKVLGFTAAVSLASGLLCGLMPALRLSTIDLADAMKTGGAGSMGGRRHQRVMNGLVVVEVALCVVAMMGAGLLINTFLRLKGVDSGFRSEGVVVASLSGPRFGEILGAGARYARSGSRRSG